MIGERTVTVIEVTTMTDDYGNETITQTEYDVPGAMFEPQQGTERTDSNSPGVVTPAKFYLPIAANLDADDVILDGEQPWQVMAGSSVWHDQTEVAVQKAGPV